MSAFASAQECDKSIFGVVYDLHDNHVLEGVKVTLVEENRQIETLFNGKFVFPALCKQSFTLLLEHVDCMPITVKINSPSNILKRFYLEHHITTLKEIIVTDLAQKSITKTGVESALSKEEINRFRAQNLGDALAQLSGVSSIKTGNAIVKPVVHGVSGSRLAIVNNGIRLQDHEWGADHAPSIDINGAHELRLIKGATSLKFAGDAIGGVLQLIPQKHLLKDSLLGVISTGFQEQGKGGFFLADITKTFFNGFYFGGTVSLKNSGDLENPNYVLSNTGNREQHAKVNFGRNTITQEWRINYSFFEKQTGILAAAHLGSVGDLARGIKSEYPLVILPWTRKLKSPQQNITHHSFNSQYNRRINNHFKWDIHYGFQSNLRKEYDLRRGEFKFRPALDIHLQTHDLGMNMQGELNDSFRWNTGVSAQIQKNFSNPDTGVRRLIPDYSYYKLGGYWISEYIPSNDFNAELGFRYDYNHIDAYKFYRIADWDTRNYHLDFSSTILSTSNLGQHLTQQIKKFGNLSASLGLKQFLGANTYLLVNIGYITRSPNPAELFSDGLHHANSRYETGELRLVQEKAIKSLVSFEKKQGKLSYSISGYRSSVRNYLYLQPVGIRQTRSISVIQANYQQIAKALLQGIDIDLRYQFSQGFSYKGTASWVEASTGQGEPIVDIPPFNMLNELLYSPMKISRLKIRLTSEYVGRQNRFPDFNFEYNFIENGEIVRDIVDVSTPPESYGLFHSEAIYLINKQWEIRLGIDNVFNVDYRNYLNRLRYFAGDTGRNFRLELSYTF